MAENTQIIQIRIDNDLAIKKVVQLTKSIEDNNARVKELKESIKELDKGSEDYAQQVQDINEEIVAINVTTDNYKRTVRETTKAITNGVRASEEQDGSLKSLRATLSKLTDAYDSLSKEQRLSNEGFKMRSDIQKLTDELKELEGETGRFQRNVGDYEGAIRRAIGAGNNWGNSLMGLADNMQNVNGIMPGLSAGIKGITSTFKKSPWLLVLLGATKAYEGVSYWYKYNKGLAEANKLTEQFTKLRGAELANLRDEISAISDEFGKEYKDVLVTTNALAMQFGITHAEALQYVKDGFILGADASEQYLDILREYPTFFAEAGLKADEFIAIVAQTTQMGVYSDKGIDAIKEATIRLREMTSATQDALEGLGLSSDAIMAGLRDGSLTTFDVIQLVSEKLNELPATSVEVGAAVADIFGGAGEDAGVQYLKTLKDINLELEEVKKNAAESTLAQERYLDSVITRNKMITSIFGNNAKSLQDMVTWVKTAINYYITLYLGWWRLMYRIASSGLSGVNTLIAEIGESFRLLGDVIESAFTFDLDKLEKSIVALRDRALNIVPTSVNAIEDRYNSEIAKAKASAAGLSVDAPGALPSVVEDADIDNTPSPAVEKMIDSSEDAMRRLETYEKQLQKIIDDNTSTIIDNINKRYDEEIAALTADYEANKANADDKIAYEKLYNDAVVALNNKRNAEIAAANQKASDEEIKRKAEEYAKLSREAALQRSIDMMNLELAGADELEILRAQQTNINAEIASLRRQDFDSEVAFEHRKTELKVQESDVREQIETKEKDRATEITNATYGLFTALGNLIEATSEDEEEAARRGKVLALAEIAFSQGVALAEGISSAMALPIPYNFIALAANIAAVVANIATAITTVKSAKFATGGLVQGAGSGTSDSIPAMLSNGESVLTARATSLFAPVLSAFNQMGGGVPIGGMAGGEDMLARAFARGAASLPAPEVAVVEITRAQKRVSLIESLTKA